MDLTALGIFGQNRKRVLTEDQLMRKSELDNIIKENFMWHLGQASRKEHTDMSKGTGLAILARVVGVDEIESELKPIIDDIKNTGKIEDL